MYSPKQMRLGIDNCDQVIGYYARIGEQRRLTDFENEVVDLNVYRIKKFQAMLNASKRFPIKYL